MDERNGQTRLRHVAGTGLLAGGLLVMTLSLAGAAADPFVAGQPAARSLPLTDGGRAALATADRLGKALGIPGPASRTVERLYDRLEAVEYDDVTLRDERGRPTTLIRLRADGSLRHVVRLGPPAEAAVSIQAARVSALARSATGAVGLSPVGEPVVGTDATGGWTAAWPRMQGGVPVAGDGIWVRLDRDGSLRSVARTESPLSATPATTLSEAEARRVAERHLDARVIPTARPDIRVVGARLEWVTPNDTFEPTRPDAPDPVRRLAWVVRAATGGPLAGGLRGLELDIDAGTGVLLGGDVLE